jgi:hypothetical protein
MLIKITWTAGGRNLAPESVDGQSKYLVLVPLEKSWSFPPPFMAQSGREVALSIMHCFYHLAK